MKKQFTFDSIVEIDDVRKAILIQMVNSHEKIKAVFLNETPVNSFRCIKFHQLISDTLFDEQLNFIEYINQTFTYLVCLYAAEKILVEFPEKKVTINFGTQPGYDVASTDGEVVCECFATASVKNNEKLKKDAARLHANTIAKYKKVVFYSENAQNEQQYIKRISDIYRDVTFFSMSLEQITQ